MEAKLEEQLNRIEVALTTLSQSISSYNPSVAAAKELLEADEALDAGLKELSVHQRNHSRIQALRAESTSLDIQLTSHLSALADLRRDIVSAPLHVPLSGARPVSSTDLLTFARATSQFLAPSSYKPPSAQFAHQQEQQQQQQQQQQVQQQPQVPAHGLVSGSVSPSKIAGIDPGTTVASPEPMASIDPIISSSSSSLPTKPQPNPQQNPGLTSLSDEEHKWLDPRTQTPFVPWVSELMIAQSGLARVQGVGGEMAERLRAEQIAKGQESKGPASRETVEAGMAAQAEEARAQSQAEATVLEATMQGRLVEDRPQVFQGWDDDSD